MRVSFPLASLNLSGGVKNTLLMAGDLASAGHDVRVIVPDLTPRPPFPLAPGVRLRVLSTGPRWLPRSLRKAVHYARLVGASARSTDLCIVPYSLTVYAAWLSRVLGAGRCRVVYVVSAYEPDTHGRWAEAAGWSRALRARLARLSYALPVERVYVSRWLARQVGEPEGRLLSLGIDPGVFHARGRRPASDQVRIGAIARRGAVKGWSDVLEAARGLRTAVPIEFVIVAVDPVALPEGHPVEATGPLDEAAIAAFYRSVDVFVFPSLSEGFPAPPLEAMACGAAVVATRSGGVEEYAIDGGNAVLVPPRDPAALRDAIRQVVEDPALRARLVAEGTRTAAERSREWMRDAVVALAEPRPPV